MSQSVAGKATAGRGRWFGRERLSSKVRRSREGAASRPGNIEMAEVSRHIVHAGKQNTMPTPVLPVHACSSLFLLRLSAATGECQSRHASHAATRTYKEEPQDAGEMLPAAVVRNGLFVEHMLRVP